MGKTLKSIIIGIIVVVLYAYITIQSGGTLGPWMQALAGKIGAGTLASQLAAAAIIGGVMGGLSAMLAPKMNMGDIEARAHVRVDPNYEMKWVFGETPAATDLLYAAQHGKKDRYYTYVIAAAGHLVEEFGNLYINTGIANFTGDPQDVETATGGFATALWRITRLGTESQSAIGDIDADDRFASKWLSTSDGLGMAHYRLRFHVKKDVWSGGIPTRITQFVKGGPVYDPRLDTTVGGSGSHRADDQDTWEYTNGGDDIGANWALICLRYLLGWKINGQLVIGMGVDPDEIDMDQAMAAANVCETTQDGIWKYRIGGLLSVTNDHNYIIGQLEGAINGKVALIGGKYYIWAPHNDLTPFTRIDEEDIIREIGVQYSPSGPLETLFNTARGRYVGLPSNAGLGQPVPYPDIIESTAVTQDGGTRLIELDFAFIQDKAIAERVARSYVRRSRFGATWRFAVGPVGLTFQPLTVTYLNCQETDNEDVLVRITNMTYSIEGVVLIDCIEEDSSIYNTSDPLGTSMVQNDMDGFDPTAAIDVTGLGAEAVTIEGDAGTSQNAIRAYWNDPGVWVTSTQVQYKRVADSDWVWVPQVHSTFLEAYILAVEPDTLYDIRARHITEFGVIGDWSATTITTGVQRSLGGDSLVTDADWTLVVTDPMGLWDLDKGDTADTTVQFNTIGPYGNIPKVMRVKGDGTAPGWYSKWAHEFPVDEYSAYISFVWVRCRTAATAAGMYVGWLYGADTLAGANQPDPKTVSNQGTGIMDEGEWYLAVGYLHSSQYTGPDRGICGIYDPADGTKIYDPPEYRLKSGTTVQGLIIGGYSTTTAYTTADGWEFTRPRVYKVDGSEPSIETALNLAAITGKTLYMANVYLRKATAPTEPPDNAGQYDFSTRILTPPSTTTTPAAADDWEVTPPAGTDPLYVSSALFETDGDTGTDTTCDWTAPQVLVTDGDDGDAIVVINAYLRKATTPTKPPDDAGEYDFDNLALTPPSTTTSPAAADDWEASVPAANGDPCYVISGTFSQPGGTGTDGTVVWTDPQILASDGVDAVLYYIKPVNGTAIKNSDAGTVLQIEARKITGESNILLTSGSIMLFDEAGNDIHTDHGYATGSDGYTGYLDAGDVNGSIVVTLSDGPSGTPLDTITLVDITDGGDAIHGYIEASAALAHTRDSESQWTPTSSVVDLTVTFVQGGSNAAIESWRLTRDDDDGTWTGAAVTLGDELNPGDIDITEIAEGTQSMSVKFEYNPSDAQVLASVTETVISTMGPIYPFSVVLSNEAHAFPASNAGVVTSYANSATLISVFEGGTKLLYDGVGTSDGTWKAIASGTDITPNPLPWTNIGNSVTTGNHSAMDNASDTAEIEYTISGKLSDGTAFSTTKVQTFTKSIKGDSGDKGDKGDKGISVITKQAFKRSSTAPGTPSMGSGSFDFDDNTFTPPSGWFESPPESDGYPCWVTTATFSASSGSGVNDNTPLWSTPELYVQDGSGALVTDNDWTTPVADPMGQWDHYSGTLARSTMHFDFIGPYGEIPKVMRIAGDGTAPGFYGGWKHLFAVDEMSSYIGYMWVRRRTSATVSGFPIGWGGLCTRIGPSGSGGWCINWPTVSSWMTVGKWYLAVCQLHSSQYTGADQGISGYYDPETGDRVYDGIEYKIDSGAANIALKFAFYSNTTVYASTDGWEVTRPRVYRADGGEPSIADLLNLTNNVIYYIKPTDGTAIKNSSGTLTIEAHKLAGGSDTLLSSGTIKLYDESNNEITVANGYDTGSDGYTGVFDAGDINGDIVVTLKDGASGDALDTITLVDITDGENAVYAFIEPNNPLAWVRSSDASTWSPTSTTVDLDCTFVQEGSVVARKAWRITRDSAGILTGASTTHKDGDLNTSRVTVTEINETSQTMSVKFAYSYGGDDCAIVETATTALSGTHGVTAYIDNGNPTILADIEGYNYATYTDTDEYITGADGTFHVTRGNEDLTGDFTGMYAQDTGDGWSLSGSEYIKTVNGATFTIHKDTGVYRVEVATTPYYRCWTSDSESVTVRVVVDSVYYYQTWTITKAKSNYSSSVSLSMKPHLVTDTNLPGGTAYAYIRYGADGNIYTATSLSGPALLYSDSGFDWLLSGTNSEYEIRATLVSGDSLDGGTLDTWQSLSSNRGWGIQTSGGVKDTKLAIEIRRATGSVDLTEDGMNFHVFVTIA